MSEDSVNWENTNLGAISEIAIGGTPARDVAKYWATGREDGYPWVSISDLKHRVICRTKEEITDFGIDNSNAKLVKSGTLMMSFKLSLGRVAFAGCDLFTNEAIASFKPSSKISSQFLFYMLPEAVRLTATDVAIKGATLNKESLSAIRISHPDFRTQQKIAAILTAADTAIEKTEALIAKYQQIKAGLMHDLFTRGVLPNGQLRPSHSEAPELYQETAIGWIPKDWQYELLDSLASRGSGHTPNKDHEEYWNGGIKWVSLADSAKLDQLYISDTSLKISAKGIQNSSAVLYPAGIVVLSRDAGIGKSAITTEPMAVSQHFMCWHCRLKMNNHFLYYWLQFNKRIFENIAMGSTILTIGLPYFKRLKIACPVGIKEQNSIANKLMSLDSHLFALGGDLKKQRFRKLGLMQDLLTGRVPVKVDPREMANA
jgi:type I restriction enzyme, S subunit